MDVVELAYARHAGQCHLGERGRGETLIAVGLQSFCGEVHEVPPRPERAPIGLCSRAECAMEGVTVGVREARNGETGESIRVVGWRNSRGDRTETSGIDFDGHRRLHIPVDER
jgi:hypothetical protein